MSSAYAVVYACWSVKEEKEGLATWKYNVRINSCTTVDASNLKFEMQGTYVIALELINYKNQK
jgi:hypothetical protein